MPENFKELVAYIIDILSLIIPLIFSLALLVIIWKIIDSWVLQAGNPDKIKEGKQYAIWGILVLVVMSAIWGILRLLRGGLFGG